MGYKEYMEKEAELLRANITEFYDNEFATGEEEMIDFIGGFNFLDAYEKDNKAYIVTYNSWGYEDYTIECTEDKATLVCDGIEVPTGIEKEICYELYEGAMTLARC